jgi:hypothetical protein
MREAYHVTIEEASKELSAKQRIAVNDTTAAIKLDEATQEAGVVIDVDAYVILNIHNEKSDNKDYKNYLILDKGGNTYVTGSENFFNSFKDIWDEMQGEDEAWQIEVYRQPSKNYAGRDFITCKIL